MMTKVKQAGVAFGEAGFKVGDHIMVTKDTSSCGFYPVGEIITLEQGEYGPAFNESGGGFNGFDCVGYLVEQNTYKTDDLVRVVARHVDRGYVAHGAEIGSVGKYMRFDDTGADFDSQLVHYVKFDDALWWLADDEIEPCEAEEDTYEEEEEEIVVGRWYIVNDSNEHMAYDADRVATDEDGEVVAFMFEEQEKEQEKKYLFVVWKNIYGEAYLCYPCKDGSAIYIDHDGFAKKASRSWETLVAQADFKV